LFPLTVKHITKTNKFQEKEHSTGDRRTLGFTRNWSRI